MVLPSFIASVGVSVTRGFFAGFNTLKGFKAESSTKLCIPLAHTYTCVSGYASRHPTAACVIDTTHPSLSLLLQM